MLLEICRKPPYHDPKKVVEALGQMFDSGLDYESVDEVLSYMEYEALGSDNAKANHEVGKRSGFIPTQKVVAQKTYMVKGKSNRNASHPTVPSTAAQEKPPNANGIYQSPTPITVQSQYPPPSAAVAVPVKEVTSVIHASTNAPLKETVASTSAPVFEELPNTLPAYIEWLSTRKIEQETIFSQGHQGLEKIMQSVLRVSRELCVDPDPVISSQLLSLCSILYHPRTSLLFAVRDYIMRVAQDILHLANNAPPSREKDGSKRCTVETLAAIVAGPVANILISVRQYQPPHQPKVTAASASVDNEANALLSCLMNLQSQYCAMSATEAIVRKHLLMKPMPHDNPAAVTTSGVSTAALSSQLSDMLNLQERKDFKNVTRNMLQQDAAAIIATLDALHMRKKELTMALDEVNSSIAIAENKQEALKHGMAKANSEVSHQTMVPDKTLIADLAAMESGLLLLFSGSAGSLDTKLTARSSTPLEHYLVAMSQWLPSQVDFVTRLTSRASKEEERIKLIEIEIESYRNLGMVGLVQEHALKAQKLANDTKEDWAAIETCKAQLRACNVGLVEVLLHSEDWRKHLSLLDCIISHFNSMSISTAQLVSIVHNLPEMGL